MLSEADADIARRSQGMPGVAVLLDDDAFRARLQVSLPGCVLHRVTRRYVRLKPGTNLLAAFDGQAAVEAVPIYAKAHQASAAGKIEKAADRSQAPSLLGVGRLVWPEMAVEVCLFPNDNKLSIPARLTDSTARHRLFQRLFAGDRDPDLTTVEPLAYKPERRFVARLKSPGQSSVVLKAYDELGFAAAVKTCGAVRDSGPLVVPALCGRSQSKRVLVFTWLDGQPLPEVLRERHGLRAACRTGSALACLHRGSSTTLPLRPRAREAGHVLAVAEGLAFLRPVWEAKVRELGSRLAAAIAGLPEFMIPIHGDFYAKQVILQNDRVGMVDFDEAALGDPAWDLGNFCAHLDGDALRGRLSSRLIEPLMEAFLEGAEATGELRRRSQLGHAAGLFKLAPHFFRSGLAEWAEITERCLERVACLLDMTVGPPAFPAASSLPPGISAGNATRSDSLAADPAFAGFGDLLDLETMTGHLRRLLDREAHVCRVESIRVLRHKPGRRALLEYALTWHPGSLAGDIPPAGAPVGSPWPGKLLGKVKSRGMDKVTAPLLAALRDRGFGDDSEDGVSVPEPLGQIPGLHVWFQRVVPGAPVSTLLETPAGPDLCRRAAGALVKLHQAGVRPSREHSLAAEREILASRLERLAAARPPLAARLSRLMEGCDRLLGRIPQRDLCGLHRDYYPDQLLWTGERIYLLDLDLYAAGNPDLDAGNFLGHLVEWSLRHQGNPEGLAECEGAFLEGYLRCSTHSQPAWVEAFATLTLARHVQLCTQFPARAHLVEVFLDLCECRLDLGRPAASSHAIS